MFSKYFFFFFLENVTCCDVVIHKRYCKYVLKETYSFKLIKTPTKLFSLEFAVLIVGPIVIHGFILAFMILT